VRVNPRASEASSWRWWKDRSQAWRRLTRRHKFARCLGNDERHGDSPACWSEHSPFVRS
jgi:hypothetical protein